MWSRLDILQSTSCNEIPPSRAFKMWLILSMERKIEVPQTDVQIQLSVFLGGLTRLRFARNNHNMIDFQVIFPMVKECIKSTLNSGIFNTVGSEIRVTYK